MVEQVAAEGSEAVVEAAAVGEEPAVDAADLAAAAVAVEIATEFSVHQKGRSTP